MEAQPSTDREFPTLHVASCITGIGLCESLSISRMQEVASHLLGYPIWTHELGNKSITAAIEAEGRRQFPNMPTKEFASDVWQAAAEAAEAAYGKTVIVKMGGEERSRNPIDALTDMLAAKP